MEKSQSYRGTSRSYSERLKTKMGEKTIMNEPEVHGLCMGCTTSNTVIKQLPNGLWRCVNCA